MKKKFLKVFCSIFVLTLLININISFASGEDNTQNSQIKNSLLKTISNIRESVVSSYNILRS